jgi:uncharacterized DUF497 family protein
MPQTLFEWDPQKADSNRAKHGVSFEEAMTVFADPLALSVPDRLTPSAEERWITIGETSRQRLVVVVHIDTDWNADTNLIRIISARRATKNEQRQYEHNA